jgi:NAD(P)H-dependent FMN reductase
MAYKLTISSVAIVMQSYNSRAAALMQYHYRLYLSTLKALAREHPATYQLGLRELGQNAHC